MTLFAFPKALNPIFSRLGIQQPPDQHHLEPANLKPNESCLDHSTATPPLKDVLHRFPVTRIVRGPGVLRSALSHLIKLMPETRQTAPGAVRLAKKQVVVRYARPSPTREDIIARQCLKFKGILDRLTRSQRYSKFTIPAFNIQIAVSHLITNAMDAAFLAIDQNMEDKDNSRVTLEYLRAQDDNSLIITLSDQGAGMPLDRLRALDISSNHNRTSPLKTNKPTGFFLGGSGHGIKLALMALKPSHNSPPVIVEYHTRSREGHYRLTISLTSRSLKTTLNEGSDTNMQADPSLTYGTTVIVKIPPLNF